MISCQHDSLLFHLDLYNLSHLEPDQWMEAHRQLPLLIKEMKLIQAHQEIQKLDLQSELTCQFDYLDNNETGDNLKQTFLQLYQSHFQSSRKHTVASY